jgi:hypothetical protein
MSKILSSKRPVGDSSLRGLFLRRLEISGSPQMQHCDGNAKFAFPSLDFSSSLHSAQIRCPQALMGGSAGWEPFDIVPPHLLQERAPRCSVSFRDILNDCV